MKNEFLVCLMSAIFTIVLFLLSWLIFGKPKLTPADNMLYVVVFVAAFNSFHIELSKIMEDK